MRHLPFIFIILTILISCRDKVSHTVVAKPLSLDSLLKRRENCILNGEPPFDSSTYTGAWNAAYAYDFVYPKNFRDSSIAIFDKEGTMISDTAVLLSPAGHASIKFWIGESISIPQDSIKQSDILRVDSKADSLIAELKNSNYPYLRNFIIDTLCHGVTMYYHDIALTGHNEKQGIIYKIEYSVLPVTGDLIAKNLVFTYDLAFTDPYRPIGITIANNFGFPKFDR